MLKNKEREIMMSKHTEEVLREFEEKFRFEGIQIVDNKAYGKFKTKDVSTSASRVDIVEPYDDVKSFLRTKLEALEFQKINEQERFMSELKACLSKYLQRFFSTRLR